MAAFDRFFETATVNATVSEELTLTDCSDEPFVFSTADSVSAGVLASACSMLGVALNACTVAALLNFPKTRAHVTTPFIVSLAASDGCFSLFTLPMLAIKFFARDWVLGSEDGFFCQIFPMLFYGNSAVTLFSLMSVTINRCVMIYYPQRSDAIFTRRNSKILIAFCWVVPFLMLTPSLAGLFGHHGLDCPSRSCTIMKNEGGGSPKDLFLFLGLVVPSIVLIITNAMIYYKVKQSRRHLEAQMKTSSAAMRMPKGLKEREQKLTKMMALIFGCFMLTYMPGVVIKLVDEELYYHSFHVAAYVVNWLAVLMNPIIYVATQDRYRQALHYMFLGLSSVFSGGDSRKDSTQQRRNVAMSRLRRGSTFNRESSVTEDA